MRTILVAFCGCAAVAVGLGFAVPAAPPPAELDRSPVGLALLPDGNRALTANQTADTVSLVDLVAGKVLAERPCGRRPAAVACSPDGRRAAVAASWAGTVVAVRGRRRFFEARGLGRRRRLPAGRGLRPGRRPYVRRRRRFRRGRGRRLGEPQDNPATAGAARPARPGAVSRRRAPGRRGRPDRAHRPLGRIDAKTALGSAL